MEKEKEKEGNENSMGAVLVSRLGFLPYDPCSSMQGWCLGPLGLLDHEPCDGNT